MALTRGTADQADGNPQRTPARRSFGGLGALRARNGPLAGMRPCRRNDAEKRRSDGTVAPLNTLVQSPRFRKFEPLRGVLSMSKSRWFGAGAGALAAALTAFAAAAVLSAEVGQTSIRDTAVADTPVSARALGDAWGIEATEWERYRTLMTGRRGLWSPDADPLLVLGAHARTPAERRRFAEAYVMAEKERVEGELAFERAVGEAWARLYGGEPMFASAAGAPDLAESAWAVRFAVAVDAGCVACRALVEEFWNGTRPVDFHVLGTGGRDAALRAWVRALDVDVSRPGVTVNHGDRFEGDAVPLVLGLEAAGAIWQWIDQEMVWVRVMEDGDTDGVAGGTCVRVH